MAALTSGSTRCARQAKQRAAIPDQIELDITTATVELKIALALAVGHRFSSLYNWQISVGVAFAYRLHKGKTVVEIWRVQIIKEQPANAALFVAMFE